MANSILDPANSNERIVQIRLNQDKSIGGRIECRAFRYQWAYTVFSPAVAIESRLEGVEIFPSYTLP